MSVPSDGDMSLLVVVVTYAHAEETQRILARFSRLAAVTVPGVSVTVATWDNAGCLPGVPTSIRQFTSDRNVGFGAAINRVVEQAPLGDLDRVLLLNPDIDLDILTWTRLVRAQRTLAVNEIWAPTLVNPDGSTQTLPGGIAMRTPFQEIFDIFGFPIRTRKRKLAYLRGAVLSIAVETFRRAGGFDERFFLYGEDADLCFRLSGSTQQVIDESLRVVHHGSQGSESKSGAALRYSLDARVRLHKLHGRHRTDWIPVLVAGAAYYRLYMLKKRTLPVLASAWSSLRSRRERRPF